MVERQVRIIVPEDRYIGLVFRKYAFDEHGGLLNHAFRIRFALGRNRAEAGEHALCKIIRLAGIPVPQADRRLAVFCRPGIDQMGCTGAA